MKKDQFNLVRAIRDLAERKHLADADFAVHEMGMNQNKRGGIPVYGNILIPMEEQRAINTYNATEGAEAVATAKAPLLPGLHAHSVLGKAGASFATGLTETLSVPVYAGSSAAWKGELAAGNDGQGAFSDVDFTPLRINVYLDYSLQFFNQSNEGTEEILKRDLLKAVMARFEKTVFSEDAAVAGVSPAGLFAGGDPSINGVASQANLTLMEFNVRNSNAAMISPAFVTSPLGWKALQNGLVTAGGETLVKDGKINGLPVLITNNMVNGLQAGADEAGLVIGSWEDYLVAQFGAFDVLVDPFSQRTSGKVRLNVNAYIAGGAMRADSFEVASVK